MVFSITLLLLHNRCFVACRGGYEREHQLPYIHREFEGKAVASGGGSYGRGPTTTRAHTNADTHAKDRAGVVAAKAELKNFVRI